MKKDSIKKYILWPLTAILTIVVIILFFPREKTFDYEFSRGKPWRYEQLTAEWDFAVDKSEDVYQRERIEAAATTPPYYTLDPTTATAVNEQFEERYNAELSTLMPRRLYNTVSSRLTEVYRDGILSTDDHAALLNDSTATVKIIVGINATERPVYTLRTVRQAYEFLMETDTTSYGNYVLRNSNLNDYLQPNVTFDQDKTNAARADAMAAVMPGKGFVQTGQKIIGSGDIVDDDAYQTLLSYRKAWIQHTDSAGSELTLLGQILIVTLLVAALIFYLVRYRRDYFQRIGSVLFLATQVIIFPVAASLLGSSVVMAIPFVMAPLIIRVFYDSRTAAITHIVIVLITSLIVAEPYIFILVQLMAGLAAIYSLTELNERSQLFRSVLIVLLTYAIVAFGYDLITLSDIRQCDTHKYILFVINAVLLLFTYPLMYLCEKLFHFTSNVTLVELSNINGKLLRTLSEEAPGTFNHSMQVANLAAAAANRLGANSQLVRTGALFHDIGKLENPAFFTENQGSTNPHDLLTPEQSAPIIIGHVTAGLRMAERYHLPREVKQFIATHHGLSRARYFYNTWCNQHPDEAPDDSLFTYPGPNPTTAETALLMMADAIEAASRSLPVYNEETINALVDRIIDTQLREGAFADCPLTFRDIRTAKATFAEKLRTIYHTRIAYPELKAPASGNSAASPSAALPSASGSPSK